MILPPIALYIHIPWCLKKCPYCDFNSHEKHGEIPEKAYIEQLLFDLNTQRHYIQNRPIHSIFIGGGTPSLFSADSYDHLFGQLRNILNIPHDIEITLEANPGAIDVEKFTSYRDMGINRLSIGVQSFQDHQLKKLGRIHRADQAKTAVIAAKKAGFDRINLDLMFGLPDQTIEDALSDLQIAMQLSPSHLSWYQLTIEPNTFFHRFPPSLPNDDLRFDMQIAGQDFLSQNQFKQYEISAYAFNQDYSQHNLNYWLFGDYLGIGAGAHAKFTELSASHIIRRWNTKHPKQYLQTNARHLFETHIITQKELPLEFMMNALRLQQPISIKLFEDRTGLNIKDIEKPLNQATTLELLHTDHQQFRLTHKGRLFLNEVLTLFLDL